MFINISKISRKSYISKVFIGYMLLAMLSGCEKNAPTAGLPSGIYLKRVTNESGGIKTEYHYGKSGELIQKRNTLFDMNSQIHDFIYRENNILITVKEGDEEIKAMYEIFFGTDKILRVDHSIFNLLDMGVNRFNTEEFTYLNNRLSGTKSTEYVGRTRYFEYDSVGNIIRINLFDKTGMPTDIYIIDYDDKRNPYYLLDPTVHGNYYYLSLTIDHFYYLSPNNMTQISLIRDSDTVATTTYSYVYNQDNYPIASHELYSRDQLLLNDRKYYFEYELR